MNQFLELYLIGPLSLLYGQLPDAKKAVYTEALKYLSADDCKRIFVILRDNHNFARFPLIAEIKTAHKQAFSGPVSHSGEKPRWEKRGENRAEIVSKFFHQFVKSQLYIKADSEGWDIPLRRYAMECANIQAQMIFPSPAKSIGYSAYRLELESDGDIARFMNLQRQNCANGEIYVVFDDALLQKWNSLSPKAIAA